MKTSDQEGRPTCIVGHPAADFKGFVRQIRVYLYEVVTVVFHTSELVYLLAICKTRTRPGLVIAVFKTCLPRTTCAVLARVLTQTHAYTHLSTQPQDIPALSNLLSGDSQSFHSLCLNHSRLPYSYYRTFASRPGSDLTSREPQTRPIVLNKHKTRMLLPLSLLLVSG